MLSRMIRQALKSVLDERARTPAQDLPYDPPPYVKDAGTMVDPMPPITMAIYEVANGFLVRVGAPHNLRYGIMQGPLTYGAKIEDAAGRYIAQKAKEKLGLVEQDLYAYVADAMAVRSASVSMVGTGARGVGGGGGGGGGAALSGNGIAPPGAAQLKIFP